MGVTTLASLWGTGALVGAGAGVRVGVRVGVLAVGGAGGWVAVGCGVDAALDGTIGAVGDGAVGDGTGGAVALSLVLVGVGTGWVESGEGSWMITGLRSEDSRALEATSDPATYAVIGTTSASTISDFHHELMDPR